MSTELTVVKQPENWIHYSDTSAQILMRTKYPVNREFAMKPMGLWITPEYAEQNWFDWCTQEDFRKGGLNYTHDIKFAKDARLLRLETSAEILDFTRVYGYNILETMGRTSSFRNRMDSIHWDRVAEKFQGILIPEYHWDLHLHMETSWYYAWDCASGCVWDAAAIESITLRSDVSAGYVTREFDFKAAMERLKSGLAEMKKESTDV